MASYYSDRRFTDYVHGHLAEPLIYAPLNWSTAPIDAEELEYQDLHHGVDYQMELHDGNIVGVQERFRGREYAKYSDATLRYRRDNSTVAERVKSEYHKIKARYLVYGITNGSKRRTERDSLTGFLKWVILDLDLFREKVRKRLILVDEKGESYGRTTEGKLYCPVKFNTDGSSSFLIIDIPRLYRLWGMDCIFAQKGFLK